CARDLSMGGAYYYPAYYFDYW
nr:immunoglobulin heavy chain junction region [Macaca mulatta]MOW93268.1 immunoglobulin heavy chain junction region [Macaca mulatta]MOW93311.1 immunoglobulin heavy chain junction region [Macaca mulatta]MOW93331.1 immunoglobulin heavy chain junction region [Macaca mulatta]MOW93375.1 immunoglobulin heavy chain junction region [Macaca mulatta]